MSVKLKDVESQKSQSIAVTQISLSLDYPETHPAKVNSVFARHETFHPRFGWLKKGFDLAKQDPDIFLREDAPVRLGVGKNMVNAIRYWCNAFKVLTVTESSKNSRSGIPSDFGKKLLDEDGWDPFLEDPASLWLLHWNLLKPTCEAAAWYFVFNVFRGTEFSAEELMAQLQGYRDSLGSRVVDSSLTKDISCILRMYVAQREKTGFVEDSIDCPFTELGIIHTAGESKRYTFRTGGKASLPAEIVVAACLEYARSSSHGEKTIAISRLLYDVGSPGMAFKLSESAICDALEQLCKSQNSIALSDSAGLIQFSFFEEPLKLAGDILDNYYRARRRWN